MTDLDLDQQDLELIIELVEDEIAVTPSWTTRAVALVELCRHLEEVAYDEG
jgi:hypothetical protein